MNERPLRDTAWAPPKLRNMLKVGTKVRLRLHSECPRVGLDHGFDVEGQDGMESKIIGFKRDESDHPYIVAIDGHFSYFAASELEPLEDV